MMLLMIGKMGINEEELLHTNSEEVFLVGSIASVLLARSLRRFS